MNKPAQFTPGPWNAYNVHKGRILKHWQVDTGTGKVMLDDAAQWEAGNATIIAAAPAMYEALQGMLEWARRVKQNNPGPEVMNALKAIAQADGRQ